ncbi:hypothetical protein ABBQ38_003329 [Trebouxia sp. C0009 RCD-2024]
MGVVTLSQPACRVPTAPTFVRLVTEARVQHKAVKRMTRNRPIKHGKSARKHRSPSYPEPPTPPPMYTVISKPEAPSAEPQ